jgi:hypothetical protein
MFDPATIHRASQQAALRAAQKSKRPFVAWPEDVREWRARPPTRFPFPYLGYHAPAGWRVTNRYQFTLREHAANDHLTPRQLARRVVAGRGYAIEEVWPSYVKVVELERVAERRAEP